MAMRIRDWNKHFETAATRKLRRMYWVPVPNKMDGEGYTSLVDHPNGAAHLGAWYAILEIASRQEVRGNLPTSANRPPSSANFAQCLGRISRIPADVFAEVIPRLVDIGWIEEYQLLADNPPCSPDNPPCSPDDPPSSPDDPPCSPDNPPTPRVYIEGNGMEGKGRESNDTDNATGECAERMYALHPKKRNLVLVLPSLEKEVASGELASDIEACHAEWCRSEDWCENNGKFVPKLDEWISDKGYTVHPDGNKPEKHVPTLKELIAKGII